MIKNKTQTAVINILNLRIVIKTYTLHVIIKMCKFNMFITAVCVSVLIKLRWPRNKSIFCFVCRGTSKRQWSSDSKVNVVKYNFKCIIILVWLCLDWILLWPAWLVFLSVGHQSWHHMNSVFSGRFYARLLVLLCLVVQLVSGEDK